MIGIDIDDVVVLTQDVLMKMAWKNLGRLSEYIAPTEWNMPNWPDEVRDEYYRLLNTDALYRGDLCDARIPRCLADMQSEFIFVTARSAAKKEKTIKQLQKLGIKFNPDTQLFCVGDGTMMGSKIDVLKKHNVKLMIDDAPHNVRECLDNGIGAVMISNDATTWNHANRGDFEHCESLLDAIAKFI